MNNLNTPLNQGHDSADAIETSTNEQTGIQLSLMWLVSCSFGDRAHEALLGGEPAFDGGDAFEVIPTAEVWLNEDRAAIVQLAVKVIPQKQPTFEAQVTYAAHYAIIGEKPVMSIAEFAWGNGLANLVPFVRAKLAQLTSESRFPTFYLQPINLNSLVASDDPNALAQHEIADSK